MSSDRDVSPWIEPAPVTVATVCRKKRFVTGVSVKCRLFTKGAEFSSFERNTRSVGQEVAGMTSESVNSLGVFRHLFKFS